MTDYMSERIKEFPPIDQCFSGEVDPQPQELPDMVVIVTFKDGARTFWHTHEGDQVLVGLNGRGWLKYRDGEEHVIEPGTIVRARAHEEHWHGAQAGETFAHLALTNGASEWLEKVEDPT